MNFYEDKKKAYNLVKKLYEDGVKPVVIYHNIISNYGFSEKTVKRWIKNLEKMKDEK